MYPPHLLQCWWQEWNRMLQADSNVWDQNAFNDLARRGVEYEPTHDRLFKYARFPSNPTSSAGETTGAGCYSNAWRS